MIKISNEFYQYQFDAPEDSILGQNIFVLYHESECIVFDAGYQRHMIELKEKLMSYTIKYVIVTHFHPDHCYGLDVLEKQHLIGNKYALETLKLFKQDDNDTLIPSTFVQEELNLSFHLHSIHIKNNPGHSKCGTVITVDDKYILIGDELMSTNDNEMCLPYVAVSIADHIKSLTFIKNNHEGKICLPSHGNAIPNITEEINKRLSYLEFASHKNDDIKQFYQDKDYRFLNNQWHKSNIK